MAAIITLTTDFGEAGGYTAALKGVILGIAPDAQIVDISHKIQPQNVFEAAFLLSTVYRCFPRSTVHLAVVDPGVGTSRKIIILRTPEGTFVGPDNGIFSYVARDYVSGPGETVSGLKRMALSGDAHAFEITNPRFFRQPVSPTFNGRDIMAPAAAMLAQGFQAPAFGQAINLIHMLDLPRPETGPDGNVTGHAVYFDGFGNIITDIKASDLPQTRTPRVEIGRHAIEGLVKTYAEGGGLAALIGSSGYLEIAVRGGSAAALTGTRIGDTIKIRAGD
ncbi:SAM hydrolase/SAM-dependent halogenase family protein [Dehalogenimonas alkenigignens]|uniref:S-adenosyl-l-methionine hydroxide adenosyltransferase n=1 Tax=Dehalogenimonas alkenigignens TaxID=1217799 RepID=A0A0W0GG71_9CHLR|nr:SAM-dependent chlorinase/fluorinase [Dehalogenimonas alkenigignens]KTB47548.1 hypothetical protein DEALK_03930 [Dehalogenimonas alkenigignens]